MAICTFVAMTLDNHDELNISPVLMDDGGDSIFPVYRRIIGCDMLDGRVDNLGKFRATVWFDDNFLNKPGKHVLTYVIGDNVARGVKLCGNLIFQPIDDGEGDSIQLSSEELLEFVTEVHKAATKANMMVMEFVRGGGIL